MKRSDLAVLAAVLASAGPAFAQNALGTGNALGHDLATPQRHGMQAGALDANSQVGANRVNGATARVDYNARNLIVTGDVAGGRGFRGSVGYLEQSEFTGKTGANDLHAWDAYGVASSPMALRAGLDTYKATQQYGAVLYSRTYSEGAARDILTNDQPLDSRIAFDRFTADGMRMRRQADIIDAANSSDSAARQDWRVNQKLPPSTDLAGKGAAGASQAGIPAGAPVDAMLSSMGLSTYERQRLKQDVLSGRTNMAWVGQPVDERSLAENASLADSHRVQPILTAEYTSLMDNMRERVGMQAREPGSEHSIDPNNPSRVGTAPSTGVTTSDVRAQPPVKSDKNDNGADSNSSGLSDPTRLGGQAKGPDDLLSRDLAWLRHELEQSGPDTKRGGMGPRANPGGATDSKPDSKSGTKPNGSTDAGADSGADAAADSGSGATAEPGASTSKSADRKDHAQRNRLDRPQNIDDIAVVLKHGRHMESLVPEDAGYIKDMMQLGADSMRMGDFFRAEERFGSVLRVIPGHPLALAGVANAQLGAGLSISAALSLRKLFVEHPEMIGTRFGPEVLPDPARLEAGLNTAQTRLRAAMRADAGPQLAADRFDYGLLIAYVGFQQDKVDVIHQGLDAMTAASTDDPMAHLLQRIWLPDGEVPAATPVGAPAVAPAPAADPAPAATPAPSADPAPAQPAPGAPPAP